MDGELFRFRTLQPQTYDYRHLCNLMITLVQHTRVASSAYMSESFSALVLRQLSLLSERVSLRGKRKESENLKCNLCLKWICYDVMSKRSEHLTYQFYFKFIK